LLLAYDGGAPGPSIMMGHKDSVHICLVNFWMGAQHSGDFARGNVLTLPAERVANTVGKVPPSFVIPPHNVAGAEPCISLPQHVAEDFTFGCTVIFEIT